MVLGQIDPWNITGSLETDLQIHEKLIFGRGAKWKFSGENTVFSKIGTRTIAHLYEKITTLIHTLYHILMLTQNG